MLVKNRMTRDPVAATPQTTLGEALRMMRDLRVRHLPVVEGGQLAGILSDRDLRSAMPSPLGAETPEGVARVESTPVAGVMTRAVFSAGPFDTVEDAAVQMRRHRVGCLPVLDAEGRLLGIITETDILHAFVEMLTAAGPSSRLEVSLADRPGELARAIRTLGEDLRINLNSVLVTGRDAAGRKTAVLHLATIDPRPAIAALEASGAVVGWPSLENDVRGMGGE
jgi:acetoin utilization protein AcuB